MSFLNSENGNDVIAGLNANFLDFIGAEIPDWLKFIGAGPLFFGRVTCFNEGTLILTGNTHFEEKWVPIEELKVGMLVKTYMHGYRAIKQIGKGSFKNNVKNRLQCMYRLPKDATMVKDLIVTGGHSILVDSITDPDEYNNSLKLWNNNIKKIDNKMLLLSSVSKKFIKVTNNKEYTYYHLVIENDGDITKRYGIWADGVLTETPSEKYFTKSIKLEL